jgi:hypothetical protein
MRVKICDGKYTVIQHPDGGLKALRYGQPWRDCAGDGLILALALEVEELREALAKTEGERDQSQPARADPFQHGREPSLSLESEKDTPELRPMLSLKQVLAIVPVSRSTLLRMVDAERFPK